jgi:hypothetical protein
VERAREFEVVLEHPVGGARIAQTLAEQVDADRVPALQERRLMRPLVALNARLESKTQRRICCSDDRVKLSSTGSRAPGAMCLRREGHDRRRARDNPAQRSARLAGLLSRVWGAAVCDPPRVEREQLAPVREAVGSAAA